jgi:alkylhydroperoxidase family enzyme
LARRLGYSDDQIQNLSSFESRTDFTDKEKIALRMAEKMTHGDGHVDESLWKQVRGAFDEGEVVELAGAIGLFNYFNRFNNALEMVPTK